MGVSGFLISVLTLKLFGLSSFMVEGPSMEPTLHDGEIFIINQNVEHDGAIERGDIVVFSFDDEPDYFYVKRIIGLPGDRVQIRDDGVYLADAKGDAQKIIEPYLSAHAETVPVTGAYRPDFKQTYVVPEGKYFVLGDNREHSLDSRYFRSPFISEERINGKYLFYIPIS